MTLKAAVLILMQPDITIHTPSLVLHCFALLYYILITFFNQTSSSLLYVCVVNLTGVIKFIKAPSLTCGLGSAAVAG